MVADCHHVAFVVTEKNLLNIFLDWDFFSKLGKSHLISIGTHKKSLTVKPVQISTYLIFSSFHVALIASITCILRNLF